MSNDLAQKSKHLAFLLRHRPETAGLTLDTEGWTSIETLVKNTDITRAELEHIVASDEKGRYSISADGLKVRANQGHSNEKVKLTFKRAAPPVVLYHGTTHFNLPLIMKGGLKPMNRHHVHLTTDIDVALSVGGRRKGYVNLLKVDAKKMLADGIQFYLSDNGVWLVDAVAPKYITLEQ